MITWDLKKGCFDCLELGDNPQQKIRKYSLNLKLLCYITYIMDSKHILNKKDFGKWLSSFLLNWNYITRKLLYNAVYKYSKYINWDVLDFWCWEKPYKNLFKYKKYIWVDYESSWHDNKNNDIDIYWDGKKIPIEDETFDSFICTEVLEHVFNIDTTLKEIQRVIKKWGKWIITIPFFVWEHEEPYDFARYTYFWIEDILKRNGFKIIKHERLWSSYLTLLQLNISVWTKIIRNSKCYKYFWKLFWFIFRLPVQIVINALSLLNFSKNQTIYLNNFLLVEKI